MGGLHAATVRVLQHAIILEGVVRQGLPAAGLRLLVHASDAGGDATTRIVNSLWPRLVESHRRAGVLLLGSRTLGTYVQELRNRAVRDGLTEFDALALTPAADAPPEDVARAALLLLPTARPATMTPLLWDAVREGFAQGR